MPNKRGFRQVALFASADAKKPTFLTRGDFEVDEKILLVDDKRKKVYFAAAHPHPAERHIYSADLPAAQQIDAYKAKEPTPVSNATEGGWHTASFDPKGAYLLLSRQGPETVPQHRVVGIDDPSFELTLEDNRALARRASEYVMPASVYYNVTIAGNISVGVRELRPHDFDASGRHRYPVLVNVYGGPNSQMVQQKWQRSNWHNYIACSMGYLVVTIDGRGTGFKGRAFRNLVTERLGQYEADDVTATAAEVARLPYVDEHRIGVWGWSYGGYLTAKLIEKDAGVFNLGMSVAPVTSWRFYDSIYTERYMKVPADNEVGYDRSAVSVTDGFRHSHYLLAQGSADDNVHYQHSAQLLDLLTASKIRGFRFRMFTDSDHSISMRGAYQELHEFLLRMLTDKWGPGGKRRFKWTAPST